MFATYVANTWVLTGNVFMVSTHQKPLGTFVQTFHQLSFALGQRKPAPLLACPHLRPIYLLFYKLLMYVWATVQVDTADFAPWNFFSPPCPFSKSVGI